MYKTALFGSSYNSTGVQNYTSTWYSTNSGFRVNITNGNNNNNGWSTVKFGRKNYASTGTIITNAAIDKKVTQVRLTIDAITASNITSITLYKSTNGSTWTSVGTFAKSTGAKDVTIAAGDQATNLYYKIEFVCTSGSSNGLITISRVDYYIDGVTTTTVTLNKNTGSTNGTAEISVGESAYTSFTAAVPASCKLCTGYWTSTSGGTKVLNPDGSFAAENVTGWITSGKWSKDATTATLYAQWRDEIYTVTLKDDDTTLPQGSCGASVTLPSRAGCSGYTFAGWTKSWTEEQDEWTTTAPTIIPAGSYTPSANENLYPVYTKTESGGGSSNTFELVTDAGDLENGDHILIVSPAGTVRSSGVDYNYNPQALSTTVAGSTRLGGTEVTISENTITTTTATVFTLEGNSSDGWKIHSGENYLYGAEKNKMSTTTTASDALVFPISIAATEPYKATIGNVTLGSDECHLDFNPSVSSGNVNKYFALYTSNFKGVYIYKETGGSTTSYISVPSCCDNIVAAPTVSATNIHYNQFTLSWTNVTGADSYTVTCTGGTPGAIQSDGTTRSCTITGLASPNTSYSWTVVATYSGSYCGATPAAGSTTTAQVYAVTYNANDGMVITLPASANYEAGVTVTVAAKPATTTKSGCTFTGWNTQNDGQGTHYDADGTKTFTMPSAAVTLYAEWTKKKNYYVDRMHGTNDGHTVTIGGVVYNCYLREGANYTVPTISDNTSGASACHSEHDHLLFWVTESSVNDDGTLKGGYTEVTPGDTKTAQSDGTVYYAIWGKLAD